MMPNPMQMISQFPQFMQQMRGQNPQQLFMARLSESQSVQNQILKGYMSEQFAYYYYRFQSVANLLRKNFHGYGNFSIADEFFTLITTKISCKISINQTKAPQNMVLGCFLLVRERGLEPRI